MKRMVFLFLLFFCLAAKSQYLDSLHSIFNNKTNIDARIETRRGLINNQVESVQGVRLGVAFRRKLRLGGGVSWLASSVLHENNIQYSDTSYIKYYSALKFAYLCFYVDFVFYKTKRWQLSVPIQSGGGVAWYQDQIRYKLRGDKKYGLFFYEPGITVQFKLTRWLGLGTDICYRYAIKDRRITERLSTPTLSLKINVWFDQLFYLTFPEHKITKNRGPAVW
jgi:hypothetical protein